MACDALRLNARRVLGAKGRDCSAVQDEVHESCARLLPPAPPLPATYPAFRPHRCRFRPGYRGRSQPNPNRSWRR